MTELRAAGIVVAGDGGYELSGEGRELLAIYVPVEVWAERWAQRERR